MAHRTSRRWAVVALATLLGLVTSTRAEPEPKKEGVTCRHWAVLLPEDAGQHRVYDGVRKGLELAQLERVCLKDVTDDETSFRDLVTWHASLPKPEPLLFAIGRRAGARLVAADYTGPGVLMSTEMTVAGEPLAAEPPLGPRMARVRAEVSAEALGAFVHDLLGVPAAETVRCDCAWDVWPRADAPGLTRFLAAAHLSLAAESPGAAGASPASPPRAFLHVRLGIGERLMPFDQAKTKAAHYRMPLVSDDPARFGQGATLVIVPDHQRVGRTAAEAGRRLWQNEPNALGQPLVVRTTEVWVDLVAAEAIGLEPPLTFLAAADRVRAPPRKPLAPVVPAPGAPGTPSPAPVPSAPK